jgi:hypothetical protein
LAAKPLMVVAGITVPLIAANPAPLPVNRMPPVATPPSRSSVPPAIVVALTTPER